MHFCYFTVGTILASFLTLCVVRIPQHRSIITPRSHCDHCQRQLTWWQLIPLIGYLIQRGRCWHCHQVISPWSFVNELLGGWLMLHCFQLDARSAIGYGIFFFTLIILATMDALYTAIYPVMFIGLLPLWLLLPHPNYTHPLFWMTTSATVAVLLLLYLAHGLGSADVEFICILLFVLPFLTVDLIILIACLGAIGYAILTHQPSRFAFLPFLCLALGVTLLIHLHWLPFFFY